MRANLRPALALQGFALMLVFSYQAYSPARESFEAIARLKVEWGYTFSALSTALFGGVVPFVVLWVRGDIPVARAAKYLTFYVSFWLWKGVEVDAFYRAQALVFGEQADALTIATKTAVDQFVYNPLWAAPTQTVFFLWKDCDFSLAECRRALARESASRRVLSVLLSTWVVWIPAVAVVYSLPSPLQLPLFNLVLCFWCLLLSFVSRTATAC